MLILDGKIKEGDMVEITSGKNGLAVVKPIKVDLG
jgi:hypothetical protein